MMRAVNTRPLATLSQLKEKLRQRGLKLTPQRLEILRVLQKDSLKHAAAEQIYQQIHRRYPTLSLATVYKTLDTLVEIGELKVALVSDGKTRYDTRLDDHHHLLCEKCGHIEDVEIHLSCLEHCSPSMLKPMGRIRRSEVVFYGSCQRCSSVH